MWTSACGLCPSPGPRAPQYYLSSLKSGCVLGHQCQNKRRSITSKVETLIEHGECQSASVMHTNRSGLVGLWGCCCLRLTRKTRCVHYTAPLENDLSGQTEHRVTPAWLLTDTAVHILTIFITTVTVIKKNRDSYNPQNILNDHSPHNK